MLGFEERPLRMGYYDTQVVCLNGHQITDRLSRAARSTKHCDQCGAAGVSQCVACGQTIRGYYHSEGVVDLTGRRAPIPKNCENCGSPFPWKENLEAQQKYSIPPLDRVLQLLRRFHLVARQLRARYSSRETISIDDEYDVQDLLHALLRIDFDDVRPEEWTPSYAGKSSRMDFLLKAEKIVIETKMARKGLIDKDVGDQLIVDVARYKEHPDCNTLVCFVYDPDGYIRNHVGLCNDLQKNTKEIKVIVLVIPSS